MARLIKDIWAHRELLLILVQRNIKIRYKGSAIGFFWTLLSPILLIVIYATFLRILRFSISLPVLVTGIIVWQFLAMCMGDSLHAILGNVSLVKKTAFPRIILPLSMVIANLVNFLLSVSVLFVYLGIVRADFGAVGWLPLIALTQCALCVGVSLIFAAANVFFRDTEHFLQILTLAWFFLTPIIYPLSLPMKIIQERFPAFLQSAFFANPMVGIVSAYRSVLLSVDMVSAGRLAISFVVAWAVLLVGIAVFQRTERRFGDEL